MEEKSKNIRVSYLLLALTLWLCVVFWMLVIFYFSSENGIESSSRGEEFSKMIFSLTGKDFSEYPIRKLAHFTEYVILTFLSYLALASSARILISRKIVVINDKDMKPGFDLNASFSIWFTVLYAVVDEYHQLFVPGRKGSIIDVLIDVAGGLLMLVIIRFVLFIAGLIRKKRPSEPLLGE